MIFDEWAEAHRAAVASGMSVLGAMRPNGKPAYVLVDKGLPESDALALAFKIRHGREMANEEQILLSLAGAPLQ
ncbi:MAG TPA: hypothetical protein VJQ57_09560 [Acidimicrobiia bacterium]|nr:hypothetical protein [Acidimicrobiia bacterium]